MRAQTAAKALPPSTMPVARNQVEAAGAASVATLTESSLFTWFPSSFNVGIFRRIECRARDLATVDNRFAVAT